MGMILPAGRTPPFHPRAAGSPGWVTVSSTAALANQINSWLQPKSWLSHPAKPAKPLPLPWVKTSLPNSPPGVFLRGSDILLEVGTATTVSGSTSPIGPAFWWALVRYYWAFARTRHGHLAVSPAASSLRHHHRQALSETLGIGVGLLLVKRELQHAMPGAVIDFVDAESALSNTWKPGLSSANRLMPDYFVELANGALLVVECKGASSYRRPEPLARGCRQLQSVTYKGSIPPGYLVNTTSLASGIRCQLFDPAGGEEWRTPATRGTRQGRAVSANEGGYSLRDIGSFRAELNDLARSSLLRWSGAEARARDLLPERVRTATDWVGPSSDRDVTSFDFGSTQYEGVEDTLRVGDLDVRFFRGLQQDYRRLLMAYRPDQVDEAEIAQVRAALVAEKEERSSSVSELEGDGSEIVALSSNGAISRFQARPVH